MNVSAWIFDSASFFLRGLRGWYDFSKEGDGAGAGTSACFGGLEPGDGAGLCSVASLGGVAEGGFPFMDVVGTDGLFDPFFSWAGGDISCFGGGRCIGGDSGAREQGGINRGGECVAFAGGGSGKVLVGCRFMFVGSGIVGWRWRGEGEEGGVASGGVGGGGGSELFVDR